MRIECLDVLNRVGQPVVRLLTRFLHHKEDGLPVFKYESTDWGNEINNPFKMKAPHYSERALGSGSRRHELQTAGYTGRNNAELHALNCMVTDALSDSELASRIISRRAERKPTGQLEAAARNRGMRVFLE